MLEHYQVQSVFVQGFTAGLWDVHTVFRIVYYFSCTRFYKWSRGCLNQTERGCMYRMKEGIAISETKIRVSSVFLFVRAKGLYNVFDVQDNIRVQYSANEVLKPR